MQSHLRNPTKAIRDLDSRENAASQTTSNRDKKRDSERAPKTLSRPVAAQTQSRAVSQHSLEDSDQSGSESDAEERPWANHASASVEYSAKSTSDAIQKTTNATLPSASASFTSISSLTPPLSSGRKVTKNGVIIVKDSDSEDGDSDSSLEDIDEVMARQKAASALASFQEDRNKQISTKSVMTTSTRLQRATNKNDNARAWKTQPQRSYKWDLKSLANQSNNDTATKERIEKVRNEMEAESGEGQREEENTKMVDLAHGQDNGSINEAHLASFADGSDAEEDPQRVIAAIRRTEALQQDLTWYFFEDKLSTPPKTDVFPVQALPETGWMTTLKVGWERQQACLTGFVADMAQLQHLPSEIITWMLDETFFEPRDDLAYAYLGILEKHPQILREVLTVPRLCEILNRFAGRTSVTRAEEPVIPTFRGPESKPLAPLLLHRLFKALQIFAQIHGVSPETRCYAFKMMLRLGMDDSIRANGQLLFSLEDAIVALAQSDGTWERSNLLLDVGAVTYATVRHAQLYLRMLQCIPNAQPYMEDFRRCLALCFFLDDKAYLSCDLENVSLFSKVIAHLHSDPRYDPSPKTNYADLGAYVSILDIAINSGFVSLPFPSKESEIDFNRSIDALSQQITTLHNGIVDTGASHMKRTEAKNALERLKFRLEFSVRTKPKPKKNVFGDLVGRSNLDGHGQDADVMTKFLGKKTDMHINAD